ncbi:MAG: hypothetical protein WA821_22140 [Anaerolineales bacterium]
MTTEKLNTAIQLIQSGHRQSAVPVLREIIQENPADEHAWLWLHTCVDQVEQKKLCLQNALKINPANQQAREALAALTAPVPAPVASADGIENREERAESREERVESREEAMEWQRTEPEQVERERTEPEKVGREKTEPEKVEREEAQAAQAQPPQIDWDEWDEVEPVDAGPRQSRPVKAPSRSARRRKTGSKWLSCFPILAGAVLFLMLFTVCFVFMDQMGLFTALRSLMPLVTRTP